MSSEQNQTRPTVILGRGFLAEHFAELIRSANLEAVLLGRDQILDVNAQGEPAVDTKVISAFGPGAPALFENCDSVQSLVDEAAEAIIRFGNHASRVLHISSGGAVYGEVPEGVFAHEDDDLAPRSKYGEYHARLEDQLRSSEIADRLIIARLTNPYGAAQRAWRGQGLIAHVVRSVREEELLTVYGNTERDYIYVHDAIAGMWDLAQGDVLGPVNVGSGSCTSTVEVIDIVAGLLGSWPELQLAVKREFDVQRSAVEVSRFVHLVGRNPLSLRSGVAQALGIISPDMLH